MECMFDCCYNLISLPNIHLINTQNITSMNCMFYKCSLLSTLPDISKWDTKNVNNMSYMFFCVDKRIIPKKFNNID